MGLLGDIMGAGASLASGNVLGAAEDVTKGVGEMLGSGASNQQVQQQLSQLDQALKLPPGTLENILKSVTGGRGGAQGASGEQAASALGGGAQAASGMGGGAQAAPGMGGGAQAAPGAGGHEGVQHHHHHHEARGAEGAPKGSPEAQGASGAASTPKGLDKQSEEKMTKEIAQALEKSMAMAQFR